MKKNLYPPFEMGVLTSAMWPGISTLRLRGLTPYRPYYLQFTMKVTEAVDGMRHRVLGWLQK